MKKRTKQMISFSIAAAMGLSLTACGGKQAEAPQTTAAETKAEGAQEFWNSKSFSEKTVPGHKLSKES